MKKILSFILCITFLLPLSLTAQASETVRMQAPDLTAYIRNKNNRHFVESMLGFYLRENTVVQETLQDGYSALFLFEGCSDNMDDPTFSDISYYRISAVCIALKLDESGKPVITYFNENCSTLPDRPLEYGAWNLETVGDVGPATICDGTYELYSVYHAGSYEALHMRTSFEDETAAAVYMTPEGFVTHPADCINIHTRTVNHALPEAMWSAGCMLVGYGNFDDFADLIAATYYTNYGQFAVGQRVGTVTINRQHLKYQLYDLYEDADAVETLLTSSRCELPETYLVRCSDEEIYPKTKTVRALGSAELMSLPCSNDADARSIPVTKIAAKDQIDIRGQIRNPQGEIWYEVDFSNENCYIRAEVVQDIPKTWIQRIADWLWGK